MNFLFAFVLLASSSTLPASGNSSKDDAGYDAESSRSVSSRSMLRKADERVQVAEEELYRDLEETTSFDQGDRVLTKDCGENKKYFKIDLRTDAYGFETSWQLKTRQGNKWIQTESGPPGNNNYADSKEYTGGYCLPSGDYRFIVLDLFSDGICCSSGNGQYSGYVDGSTIFSLTNDDSDWEKKVHGFKISTSNVLPFNPKISLSDRNNEWLVSHNTRRKNWHERYGKTYVPLKWSNSLEEESRVFAEKLLEGSCGLYHDPGNLHGENLALHTGNGLKSPDSIVTRWVENEIDDGWPGNGHLTQVLWRPSKYVGCAEAVSGSCHTQVCRYARPGNCNMNKYKTNKDDWWLKPMLMDDSPCSPKCPPDGCQ
eukprot:CAMPEP_0172310254 /NCGR_PEP_ID=MMETSP1058-20130122/11375_1 /TAXON_ID=83371 /ORGANISM="Detonula confervacea, Strain CCMP 353" /LENGTH=369 /DNA_ID=CAMNT_0013023031 /DNA_START=8 /DNA_END=1117 /DNA_ORIENTATION=-